MDSLRSWAATICFAALAAGMAGIVAPKGNLEKIFKFAVSLFFLCCVLVPLFSLKNIDIDFSLNTAAQQGGKIVDIAGEQTVSLARENISNLIISTCAMQGVTPLGVDVDIVQDANGAFSDVKAQLTLSKTDMKKESLVKAAVRNELGIDITVQEGASG